MNRGSSGSGNAGGRYQNVRGRSPRPGDYHTGRFRHAEGDEISVAGSSSNNEGALRDRSSKQVSSRNFSKQYRPKQTLNSQHQVWLPSNGGKNTTSDIGNLQRKCDSLDDTSNTSERLLGSVSSNLVSEKELSSSAAHYATNDLQSGVARVQIGESAAEGASDSDPLTHDHCNIVDPAVQQLKIQNPSESGFKDDSSSVKLMINNATHCQDSEDHKPDPFDICHSKSGGGIKLNASLLVKNREKRNDVKRATEGTNGIVLRPGMILLKSGILIRDQVRIVKKCQELGLGPGGFYQPGYREGGKLHLKMMCLGKNWDPETSTYGEIRQSDGTKPPGIPIEFYQLVEKAMKDSYALLQKDQATKKPEHILPSLKPDICIVNFYSQNGRLGLHQDRDESPESLKKGLPVVSFSIGDSAEFLFGDQRETEQAEKVTLDSGDILIFGGKARNIFHGVTAIKPNTAPKTLLEEANLRPGRLNLTFRQY